MLYFTASLINVYWLTVVVKSVIFTKNNGSSPNVIPKETNGMFSRLVMVPLIILWNTLPWYTANSGLAPSYFSLSIIGLLLCFSALMASFYCWAYMGSEWRIGINEKEKTNVLTSGPFKYIRHPIYTLSILLMTGTFLCLQTPLAAMLWLVHICIFTFEAWREEQYILSQGGNHYGEYMLTTGRFFPKLFSK